MQPQTEVKFDRATFDRLKQRVKHISKNKKKQEENPAYAMDVPAQIGIKVNNGCNLRCKHCFEWNEEGFHNSMSKADRKDEIEPEMLHYLLDMTKKEKSKLYLWGGEPLIHTQFDRLMQLIEQDPRWTTICTNAVQTEKRMDSILRISEHVAYLASLEGLEKENDEIRGKGVFQKVVDALQLLLDLRRKGIYKGTIALGLTISDTNIHNLYNFLEYFEEMGLDSVYMVFPWYIPETVSRNMDHFVETKMPWISLDPEKPECRSWHSYRFHVSPESIPALLEESRRIRSRIWRMRVRFHPALNDEEVSDFVLGSDKPAEGKKRCLAMTNRIDIMPNGDVSSCKFFHELSVGNVLEDGLKAVWKGEKFQKFRETVGCGLMPVCSKCTLLYSTG